jgi:ketosteroid isomerase-like protein
MKRILLAMLLAATFTAAAAPQGATGDKKHEDIEKEILAVEQQRDQAIQDRDMKVLDHIHADDFTFVNTRGGLLTKAEYLEEIRTGGIKFLSFKQDDYHVQVYPGTVIVTGRSSGVIQYHGKVNEVPRRFTLVYVRDQGRWRLATYHGTVIVEQ